MDASQLTRLLRHSGQTAARPQSMLSVHTLPTQAVLTVNIRIFGRLISDYDNNNKAPLPQGKSEALRDQRIQFYPHVTGLLFQDFSVMGTMPHFRLLFSPLFHLQQRHFRNYKFVA